MATKWPTSSWSLHKKCDDQDTRKDATITEFWKSPNASADEPEEWFPCVSKYAVPHTRNESGLDPPVLRYADVLLLKAEALYQSGQPAQALTALNQVRARAFGGASHHYEMADLADATDFMDAIMLERQLEFALGNERWFDLVRTGRCMEVLATVETSYNYSEQTAFTVELAPQPHHQRFPIPQHEIDQADAGVLTQNEGY